MKGEAGAKESTGRNGLTLLPSSEGLYIAYTAPSVSSWTFTILLCDHVVRFVSVKTSGQLLAASGLLYEAMGMTLSDPSHTQTHISKCRQISHAFFLPFRSPPPPPPLLSFFSLVTLVTGKVLIGLFPKLFLIKDKQGIHISLGEVGLPPKCPVLSLVSFRLEGGAMNGRDEARDVSTRGCVS